jgi:hypothetical protein
VIAPLNDVSMPTGLANHTYQQQLAAKIMALIGTDLATVVLVLDAYD